MPREDEPSEKRKASDADGDGGSGGGEIRIGEAPAEKPII